MRSNRQLKGTSLKVKATAVNPVNALSMAQSAPICLRAARDIVLNQLSAEFRVALYLLPNSWVEVLRGKEILKVYKDSYPPIHKHLNQSSFARESKLTISYFYHTYQHNG
jgi:hypothetical protein